MTLPDQHVVTMAENGPGNIIHPDPDHDGCDIEAYLASDWPAPVHPSMQGTWSFYWMGTYWNGSRNED